MIVFSSIKIFFLKLDVTGIKFKIFIIPMGELRVHNFRPNLISPAEKWAETTTRSGPKEILTGSWAAEARFGTGSGS